MGRAMISLLVISFLLAIPLCYSQEPVKVSDPRLEIRNNILHIFYDILNSDPDERFNVDIEIRDEDGQFLDASALTGDIGKDLPAGRSPNCRSKCIIWDSLATHTLLFCSSFQMDLVINNYSEYFQMILAHIHVQEPELMTF